MTAPLSGTARPNFEFESSLLTGDARAVAGMDEVGRGALAGPVMVGVVIATAQTGPAPEGVADSKLLRPAARQALVPAIREWAAWGVGHASPAEIDEVGITGALRLAGLRALTAARERFGIDADVVVLDGTHDWLTGAQNLFEPEPEGEDADGSHEPAVIVRAKADRDCATVAAASVLAKVERDALMVALAQEHPEYGWESNKGYGAAKHLEALRQGGPTEHHRRSWRLPEPRITP